MATPEPSSVASSSSVSSARAAEHAVNESSEGHSQPSKSAKPKLGAGAGLGLALAVVSVLVGVSAVWGIYNSVSGSVRIMGLLGFEIVSLVACIFGVLVGLGRFGEAQSLAAFNIALTIFVAAGLGRFSAIATRTQTALAGNQILGKLLHDPMFEARFAAAALIGLLAIGMAFGSARESWKRLGVGIVLGIPVVIAFGWLAGPGKAWLLSGDTAGASMLRMVVGVIGGVLLTIFVSSSVEQIIDSFAIRLPKLPTPAPVPTARKKTKRKPTKKA